jgi:hypothetical protein
MSFKLLAFASLTTPAISQVTFCSSKHSSWDFAIGNCVCTSNQVYAVPAGSGAVSFGKCIAISDFEEDSRSCYNKFQWGAFPGSCSRDAVAVTAIVGCTSENALYQYYGWSAVCSDYYALTVEDCQYGANATSRDTASLDTVMSGSCSCPTNYPYLYVRGGNLICSAYVPKTCSSASSWFRISKLSPGSGVQDSQNATDASTALGKLQAAGLTLKSNQYSICIDKTYQVAYLYRSGYNLTNGENLVSPPVSH